MDVRRLVVTNRDSSPLCQDCGFCCTMVGLSRSAEEWLEGETDPRERKWLASDLIKLSPQEVQEAEESGLLVIGLMQEGMHFYNCSLWDRGCTDYDNRPSPCKRYPYYMVGSSPLKPVFGKGCRLADFLYSLLNMRPQDVELRKNGRVAT